MSQIRKLIRLPAHERRLLAQALILIGMMRLSLRWLPLRVTRRIVSRWAVPAKSSAALPMTPARIGWAVERAGRAQHAPCLPRALAGYILLRRSGCPVHLKIGIAPHAAHGILGHAWIEYAGKTLVGYRADLHAYTVLPVEWSRVPS